MVVCKILQYPPNSFCIIEHNKRIGFKWTTNQEEP